MKKALKLENQELYFYKDGVKYIVNHKDKTTYPSGLLGNVTELSGDVSGLSGDVTGLFGNVSGLSGNCTNIVGNLDNCEITDEERKKGINIEELIK